jgi:ADP-ribose pyrophosphatase YjhB (NUDIX family)
MLKRELQNFIDHGHREYLPHVSIDCAVFGFHNNDLKILLLKWKYLNGWSLPGGYMKRDEPAENAASRLLEERTGISKIFFKQYHTFTDPDRTKVPGTNMADFGKALGVTFSHDSWLSQRVISMGYYALVEYSQIVKPQPDFFTEECSWCDLNKLPRLLFDHAEMIRGALKALRLQIIHEPVGLNLLPKDFTMSELQRLYETILDLRLDRANFRKKIMGLGIVRKTGERPSGKPHKTPHLYSFDKRAYSKALKSGINFSI